MRRLMPGVLVTALMLGANGAIAQTSSGTAFAVAPELLVTNRHVVVGCSSIEIVASDGRRPGSVVVADADVDLALLRATSLKGATARLRSPHAVRLGEPVMVFGYPLAGALSSGGNFTSGLVSALRGLRDAAGAIQITAPVQRGNSGGPLLDASGLVVGVVQSKLDAFRTAKATGDIPQNINFAISLEVLAEFLAKNQVPFQDAAAGAPLDTAKVAELAQSFTYRVECRGRPKQAATSPQAKQSQLPACSPPYNAATWTSCFGSVTSTGGSKYIGEFRDGKPGGLGTSTNPDGRRYVGEFKDGKRHGRGTSTMPNGAVYVGEFKDGKYDGHGTYTFPDGRKHVGEFGDGKLNGQGTQYNADGSIQRSGTWVNGVFSEGR